MVKRFLHIKKRLTSDYFGVSFTRMQPVLCSSIHIAMILLLTAGRSRKERKREGRSLESLADDEIMMSSTKG